MVRLSSARIPAAVLVVGLVGSLRTTVADGPVEPARSYFAHAAIEDGHGVIAPWYTALNGQCDFRIRVAAETLKRYPWADKPATAMSAPHYVFNGHWKIDAEGTIAVDPALPDWHNGDLGQRSAALLCGLTNYYRYTGDAGVIGPLTRLADYLLDYCQTPPEHPWPGFLVSCPTKGKAYGRADPHGFIQLDVAAQVGTGLVAAYKLIGEQRYLDAVQRWADLLAAHCDARPGQRPWNRYANPEDCRWDTRQTGGVALVLEFLDEVIKLGHRGQDDALVKAREAGERYLRDTLLPRWSDDPTFGHNFWDWQNHTATCSVPCYVSQYMMNRPEAFPTWQADIRNIVSLFFCRSSVDPGSAADLYSGAWALPESSSCCGKSLQYPIMSTAAALARYGELADSEWAREIARRQAILSTYDAHETGVVEDGIDGGAVVAAAWFNLAHPWPLRMVLEYVAWQPECFGANRENHIVRSNSVVTDVRYGKGRIAYATFPSPGRCEDVLRLAFVPRTVSANGRPLPLADAPRANGYRVRRLSNGDALVTIRHDDCPQVVVEGEDPQQAAGADRLEYTGDWQTVAVATATTGSMRVTSQAGARAKFAFEGNQVRLIGRAAPDGGRAEVYLDGVKQLCGIDFWCPQVRDQQVLCYKNGLTPGRHTLEIVALGAKNPVASGAKLYIDGVQWSATHDQNPPCEARGPGEAQRVIFGRVDRQDYVDSTGQAWRPATEFIYRIRTGADLVPIAFWTDPRIDDVGSTADPELYRYGLHGPDFTAYFTVDPTQTYHVRLKFCQTDQPTTPGGLATSIDIQGSTQVLDMDIAATAGGLGKAVDLVFNGVHPRHGAIAIRAYHRYGGDAMIQAIEIGPGESPVGATPVVFDFPPGTNLLRNPGFETAIPGATGRDGHEPRLAQGPWSYRFLGPSVGIVWNEAAFVQHPQSGQPTPRSGKDALRTHAMEQDAHTQVYQEVAVEPGKPYRASVWVQGIDLHGQGFGTHAEDTAGLCVIELDAAGRVLVQHPRAEITKAGEFTELSTAFTTSAATAIVRFLLDTRIACRWDQGHVTYDDCTLARQAQ